MSSHVSPAARAAAALMTGRTAFIPVDATLAPGPYTPPLRSESRVAVSGRVRPPGGPDKNFAMSNVSYQHRLNGDTMLRLTLLGRHLIPIRGACAVLCGTDARPVAVTEGHLCTLIAPIRSKGVIELGLRLVDRNNVVVAGRVEEAKVRLRGCVAGEPCMFSEGVVCELRVGGKVCCGRELATTSVE